MKFILSTMEKEKEREREREREREKIGDTPLESASVFEHDPCGLVCTLKLEGHCSIV
jgi:hypothetical protein